MTPSLQIFIHANEVLSQLPLLQAEQVSGFPRKRCSSLMTFSDEEKLYAEGGRVLNRLPREVMESPSLETFKTHPDTCLCHMVWVTLPCQGGWTGRSPEVCSNRDNSVIQCGNSQNNHTASPQQLPPDKISGAAPPGLHLPGLPDLPQFCQLATMSNARFQSLLRGCFVLVCH